MSELFGSGPSVSTINPGSSSTLNNGQQNINSMLASFLGQGSSFFNPQYTGQLTAGETPQQLAALQGFSGAGGAVSGNIAAGQGGLASAISGLQGIENSGPADFSSYFQNSVVKPNETAFNQQTLPSVERAFAASPGGGSSGTDYGQAINAATTNLDQTLASAGSSAALTEYNANQQNKLSAASELGTLANTGFSELGSILGADTTQQQTNQLTDTNAYNAFNTYNAGNSNFANLLNSYLGTKTTTQNDVVAQQGMQGGIGSLLGGLGQFFGSGSGGTSGALGIAQLLGL